MHSQPRKLCAYDLSREQLETYQAGEPMTLLVPCHPTFTLGRHVSPDLLASQVLETLPDIEKTDVDYVGMSHVWCNMSAATRLTLTSLGDFVGTPMPLPKAKALPVSIQIRCIEVSVNDGRAERAVAAFPGGAIRLDGEIYFGQETDQPGHESGPGSPAVDPDYFVDDNFGGPIE